MVRDGYISVESVYSGVRMCVCIVDFWNFCFWGREGGWLGWCLAWFMFLAEFGLALFVGIRAIVGEKERVWMDKGDGDEKGRLWMGQVMDKDIVYLRNWRDERNGQYPEKKCENSPMA